MDGIDQFNLFISVHKPQLVTSGVPAHFWRTLWKKLSSEMFDAGNVFSMMLIDYGDEIKRDEDPTWMVVTTDKIQSNDPSHIYLIDHAWTFRVDSARAQLEEIPGLCERMAAIMGIHVDDESNGAIVDEVLRKIWRFSNMYSINADGVSVENRMPIWYVMDELGSAVAHNDNPKFRIVPFIYLDQQVTYSLLFPIENAEEGDSVTRNFVEHKTSDDRERRALLLPWEYTSFLSENLISTEPDEEYFLEGHIPEELPLEITSSPVLDRTRRIKVYSEYELIRQFLTDSVFEIVNNEEDADILWYTTHFKKFKDLHESDPNKFISQFPYEYVFTIKDLLSIICKRNVEEQVDFETLRTHPNWLPTTYNMKTELLKFVSYFQNRERKGLDNHWIIKPWNLARGLDTYITNDIAHMMRISLTGPKIVQKYIENPVLFDRPDIGGKVKFDIRYVILLKSCDPLEAYVHRKCFLRFANKPFALDKFDDYQKHFTVMNYSNFNLRHIPCDEFLELWGQQYPDKNWMDIEKDICNVLREMLKKAMSKKPPAGIAPNPQSRALYAADIMLAEEDGTMQPKLLEVNWVPDCKRACDYYPDFFNDIFKLLFLDVPNNDVFREI